ncbi:MAG: hypothetical protein ABI165_21775, partial [Bryobacteraceae bacterium]
MENSEMLFSGPSALPHGATIVTGNSRLSLHLRREFDAAQRAQGRALWESPGILPRKQWLRRCWDECFYADPLHTPVLLDAAQELVLWEQAIDRAGASGMLLDSAATALAAVQAWKLLHGWELPRNAALFEGL